MRAYGILLAFCVWMGLTAFSGNYQGVSSAAFYSALRSDDLSAIDSQLQKTINGTTSGQARKGSLLMKKAGLKGSGKEKVSLFNEGRALLESAIRENDQTEFHFMRLIIQENAPAFLKYHENIGEDCSILQQNFSELPAELQKQISNYATQSKNLKPETLGKMK